MTDNVVVSRWARTGVQVVLILMLAGVGYAVGQQGRTAGVERRVIQPPNYKPSPAPLVPAILVGDTLDLSGSTGADPSTGLIVQGGLEAETRQILTNVQTVLGAAGMTLDDVVATTVYLTDMGDYARFNELYRSPFTGGRYPTRSAVAVKELARGARVEVTMTAVRSK